ncbi:pilin [Vibrio sp. 10N.261.51.F12]|uniref:pilin n=1 Tax=Vibrio sp. 10N.261.51.F12 TaxID=3229679 RepID=UPI00354D0BBF
MKKNIKQQGFTLIELMIVVAVIGVLAAVALPQYQKYVGKSEAASALATLSGLKTNVETYTLEKGSFPNSSQNGVKELLGFPSSISNAITSIQGTVSAAGSVVIAFSDIPNSSPSVKGQKLGLIRDENGGWSCKSTASENSGVLPKGCSEDSNL